MIQQANWPTPRSVNSIRAKPAGSTRALRSRPRTFRSIPGTSSSRWKARSSGRPDCRGAALPEVALHSACLSRFEPSRLAIRQRRQRTAAPCAPRYGLPSGSVRPATGKSALCLRRAEPISIGGSPPTALSLPRQRPPWGWLGAFPNSYAIASSNDGATVTSRAPCRAISRAREK